MAKEKAKKARTPLPTDPAQWGHTQDVCIVNGIGKLWNRVLPAKRGPIRGYIEGLINQRDVEEVAPGKPPQGDGGAF